MERNFTKAKEELFECIIEKVIEIDFRQKVLGYSEKEKISAKHYTVVTIEELIRISDNVGFSIIQKDNSVFIYNGEFWILVEPNEFKNFLGKAALKMGVPYIDGKHYGFINGLYLQFFASAKLATQKEENDNICINLKNGTFKFIDNGFKLYPFDRDDFMTYQLPFEFNETAEAETFKKYLDQVIPDINCQNILAEFIGYIFAKKLKLEKCLLLYGSGANGKSVFFDIVNALLGKENVTNFTLGSLSEEHNRAMIANKLLNYGSELKGNMDIDIFKQIVSNEPIHCRHKYGNPFMCSDYARLLFNCNELPKQAEITTAYFRRFLIVPFEVTIPENERNPELAQQIIDSELSGIFNWVLQGVRRLISNKHFTDSEKVKATLTEYRLDSDSVASYLHEEKYVVSTTKGMPLKALYNSYQDFCKEENRRVLSCTNFSRRLKNLKFEFTRNAAGTVVWIDTEKNVVLKPASLTLDTPRVKIYADFEVDSTLPF